MTENRPAFLFVCDHGTSGDHSQCDHSSGCREVDRVGLLQWFPDKPGWWAIEDVDGHTIETWPMEGGERGHGLGQLWPDPEYHNRKVNDWYTANGLDPPDDPRRWAIAITCPAEHCTTWAYRTDDVELQTLLTKLATDTAPCSKCGEPFAITIAASEELIVLKLQMLHLARQHARKHYGLRV
jgi:hypothetical protein